MTLSFANAIPGRVKAEVSRSLVGFFSSFPSLNTKQTPSMPVKAHRLKLWLQPVGLSLLSHTD